MRLFRCICALVFFVVAFPHCAVPLADEYKTTADFKKTEIHNIAILPTVAETTDVRGEAIVREIIEEKLPDRGYSSPKRQAIDEILHKRFGITQPGQINAAKPAALCEATGSDALLYSTIEDWNTIITGAYNKTVVRLTVRLFACSIGREVWRATDEEEESSIDVLPHKMATNALRVGQASYHLLSEEVVYNCLDSLPDRK